MVERIFGAMEWNFNALGCTVSQTTRSSAMHQGHGAVEQFGKMNGSSYHEKNNLAVLELIPVVVAIGGVK